MPNRITVALAVLASGALPLSAQRGLTCDKGPGGAVGITAYQCASCGFKRDPDGKAIYSFYAEPVVQETIPGSAFRPGDVIEAVDAKPITTAEGAENFAHPRPGVSVITVRRGRDRLTIHTSISGACRPGPAPPPLPGAQEKLGLPDVVISRNAADSSGRFGFAVACVPSCTRTRASDGTVYWKYDGYPHIAAVRLGGPADRAGLQNGDVVLEIDGSSILSEAGVLRLLQSERRETLRVTVERAGRRIVYRLTTR